MEKGSGQEIRQALSGEELRVPALAAFGYAEGKTPPLPVLEHRHREKFEFIFCAEGMQSHVIHGQSGTAYSGEALIIRPDEEHACAEEQPGWSSVYWFQIDMTVHQNFLGLTGEDALTLYRTVEAFQERRVSLPEEGLLDFERAFYLLQGKDPLGKLEGRLRFISGLLRLLSAPSLRKAITPEIDRAKQYILLHIREAVDIDELLLASGLGMKDFRREFEEQIGCSVREYIIQMKIEKAKGEVANSNRSIADIAYRYHFSSPGFFRMRFKQETGMSIRQYRRKMKR